MLINEKIRFMRQQKGWTQQEMAKRLNMSANGYGNIERVNNELTAQKSSNATVSNTLQQTHAKLMDVIEKYNALNKSKNELSVLHVNLENSHKQTEAQLQTCEEKNIKLFEAGKEILNTYENKSVMDSFLKSDPIFQFKSVEMEGIAQEYEDKLSKQKLQSK